MPIDPREAMITDAVDVLAPAIDYLESASVKVHVLGNGASATDGAELTSGAPVVIVGLMKLGVDEIGHLRDTGLIIRAGVGYDVIDVEAATAAGIWVANVPDFCVEEVADHSMLLLLAAMRRLPDAMQLWRDKQSWHVTADLPPAHRLSGKRLGLVGLGRIGRLVAQRARGFGWDVVSYDPYLSDDQHVAAGATPVDLDELFATSDAISLHCPLTAQSHHLVDDARLESTKQGVIIVNTSRGGLIDLDALDAALESGSVGYAALDVLDGEPDPDLGHPLLARPNVLVTSHTAWYSVDAFHELAINTAKEAIRFLDGERPLNLINPKARKV